jgi:hypothetical protein
MAIAEPAIDNLPIHAAVFQHLTVSVGDAKAFFDALPLVQLPRTQADPQLFR